MRDVGFAPPSRRVLMVFEDRARLLDAVRTVKSSGLELVTAFAPAYDKELVEASSRPSHATGAAALAGAVAGAAAGLTLTVWTTAQWPLIVGGKPHIPIPPFLLIAFELAILVGSLAATAVFLWQATASRLGVGEYDPRFSDARFGLLIRGDASGVIRAIDAINQAGVVEWRHV